MKKDTLVLTTAALLLLSSSLAFPSDHSNAACTPTAHSVTSLPYFNAQQTLPCTYAGTFQTGLTAEQDHNLFYWFFRNTNDDSAPLVAWFNGGPGASSMPGLFYEQGPLRANKTGDTADDFEVSLAEFGSWLDIANVVYIDQPVGVGFSYGNSVLDRMDDGAEEIVKFFLAFYQMYPDFASKPLILTGQSYAGKYIPIFAKHIIAHNKQTSV